MLLLWCPGCACMLPAAAPPAWLLARPAGKPPPVKAELLPNMESRARGAGLLWLPVDC